MTVLGVIGPIASGKSLVLEALACLGAATLQADDASRALLQPGRRELQVVVEAFGPDILQADGTLNRQALGDRIFANAAARERLEAILHPPMVAWLRAEIARLGNTAPAPVVIALEAAILDQMGARPLCDKVLLVTAARGARKARLVAKGLSPEQVEARLAVQDQMPLDGPADYVIDTGCPPAQTRAKVAVLWRRLTAAADHRCSSITEVTP